MRAQDDRVVQFFSDAKAYAKLYQGCDSSAYFLNARLSIVYDMLSHCLGKRVLDCGCGPGIAVDYLAGRDCQFIGVDLSNAMIHECQEGYGGTQSAHFSVARIENLPFSTSAFDIVLCLGVIEYSQDTNRVIQELSRVTRKDGIVILTMLNRLSPWRLWYDYVYTSHWLKPLKKALGRESPEVLTLRLHTLTPFQVLLTSNELMLNKVVYYGFNVCLAPIDRYLPRISVFLTRKLEFLDRTRLRSLGTGFIIMAQKQGA
jgi:ubiquinone/menaquinone biosynthesis C-methylase UbiE